MTPVSNTLEWAQFVDRWKRVYYKTLASTEMRQGQAMFHALAQVDVEIADRVVGTDFDPFYDDNLMYKCAFGVHKMWAAKNPARQATTQEVHTHG